MLEQLYLIYLTYLVTIFEFEIPVIKSSESEDFNDGTIEKSLISP